MGASQHVFPARIIVHLAGTTNLERSEGLPPSLRRTVAHSRGFVRADGTPHRKQYWDRDYVRSLEDQIKNLSSGNPPPGGQLPGHKVPVPEQSDPQPQENDGSAVSTTRSKALSEFTGLAWKRWDAFDQARPLHTGPFGYFSIPFRRVVPIFEEPDPAPESVGMVSP